MNELLKISKIKILVIAVMVPILLAGTVVAYNIATPNENVDINTKVDQVSSPENTEIEVSHKDEKSNSPPDQNAVESPANTQTRSQVSQPATTTVQQAPASNRASDEQVSMAPAPAAVKICNETMKASYTSLYNSKVNAENASWTNQVNSWNNQASANGMSFSGYVQSKINDNKPAHDARLAQLQTQYYQNLVSINCST